MSTLPTAVVQPSRIKKLILTDFRGFPGPASVEIKLDGKNLLVYGENGSGKSSVFYALRGFFSLKDGKKLRDYKNVFSGEPDTTCKVGVEFTDNTQLVEWTLANHPGSIGTTGADQRVVEAALRRACLDYRALLDTNYLHGTGEINLFEIAVEHLLRDYPVTPSGGVPITIGELWERVVKAKPYVHTSSDLGRIAQACIDFNTAFQSAIPELVPHINNLMTMLGYGDIVVHGFRTPGLTYNKAIRRVDRKIDGRILIPELSLRNRPLATPQTFLNEARLSALGLAIYLAGRLVCTPSAPSNALKLLILDDVLIGLDHSNRLPVIEVLKSQFSDWQIVLLTFDRVWFEMVRMYIASDTWKCIEVFDSVDSARGISAPILRTTGDNACVELLNQAEIFITDNHIAAASNYTRAAFELSLKQFCEAHHVPVQYKFDQRHLDTDDLLSSVQKWLKACSGKTFFAGIIERVKLFRRVVLNPYSHSAPPNIARGEVVGAIAAVRGLIEIIKVRNPNVNSIDKVATIIAKPTASVNELHQALGHLRSAFFLSLCSFCKRKRVMLAFTDKEHDCQLLWTAILADQGRLFLAPHDRLPVQIDAERGWLIAPVDPASLAALTQVDLARIYNLIVTTSTMKIILETI